MVGQRKGDCLKGGMSGSAGEVCVGAISDKPTITGVELLQLMEVRCDDGNSC